MAAPELDDITDAPDEELVDLIREGNQQAFANLYDRYFKRIYHFVSRRLNNTADVEETVQEVFINVFSSLASYRGDAPIAAWIFGVTRRTIASRFKKRRHPVVPLDEQDAETASAGVSAASGVPSAIENIECKQRIRTIDRLVTHRLTPEQQVLFQLHHLENRPIQEIAISIGKSENAIKSNLYRARKILLAQ